MARGGRDRFFLWMGVAMLVLVAVGFARTFYLRPLSDLPELPLRLRIHGLSFSLWIVLFVVQAALIEGGKPRVHRRLGLASLVLAVAMVASGLTVLHAVMQRSTAPEVEVASVAPLVWGNVALLVAFSGFYVLALVYRRRPQVHKRLILLATITMMGQATSRVGQLGFLRVTDVRFVNDAVYGIGGLLVLLLIMVGHDLVTRRRPHVSVALGAPALVGALFLGVVISNSSLGHNLIRWLR